MCTRKQQKICYHKDKCLIWNKYHLLGRWIVLLEVIIPWSSLDEMSTICGGAQLLVFEVTSGSPCDVILIRLHSYIYCTMWLHQQPPDIITTCGWFFPCKHIMLSLICYYIIAHQIWSPSVVALWWGSNYMASTPCIVIWHHALFASI